MSRGTECILTQGLVGEQGTSRMLKQSRFSPARPKARQDAPFPIQRYRLIEILNIPLPGKELFRQMGVGRVAMLRLRFRFAFGLAGRTV